VAKESKEAKEAEEEKGPGEFDNVGIVSYNQFRRLSSFSIAPCSIAAIGKYRGEATGNGNLQRLTNTSASTSTAIQTSWYRRFRREESEEPQRFQTAFSCSARLPIPANQSKTME
jgi:hypothetical protein